MLKGPNYRAREWPFISKVGEKLLIFILGGSPWGQAFHGKFHPVARALAVPLPVDMQRRRTLDSDTILEAILLAN